MRLVTFRRPGSAPEAGAVVRDQVVSLSGAGFPNMLAVLSGGVEARAKIENWSYHPPEGSTYALNAVKLLAPIPRPPKLICVGLNYRDHAAESKMEIPKVPTIFNKFTNVVIAPADPIVLPAVSTRPDYEAEFAFVIGPGGRNIKASKAMHH